MSEGYILGLVEGDKLTGCDVGMEKDKWEIGSVKGKVVGG